MTSSNEAFTNSAGSRPQSGRTDCFWAILALVAALMLVNVTMSMLAEFLRGPSWAHRLGIVLFGPVGFLFWFWLMAGAWRRFGRAKLDPPAADPLA